MSIENRIRKLEKVQTPRDNDDLATAIARAQLLSAEERQARIDKAFSRPVSPCPEIENLSAEELLNKIRSVL